MSEILLLGLLIVIWWIGIWGVVETLIHLYIRGNTARALFVYSSMIMIVLFYVYLNPTLIDYFV